MSQYPPPGKPAQPAYQMQPQQSNGWGLASLICGILSFCTGGIAGILAIIFGFVGIKRSKTTNSGKGMSIVGLVLGLLTIVGWVIFLLVGGLAILGLAKASEPQRQANQQFIKDLASGNVAAATNDTDGMSQTEVQALIDQVKDMGAVKDVTNVGFHFVNDTADLAGIAQFDKGKMGYSVHEVKKGDAWKISTFTFNQTSAPATSESTTPATTEPTATAFTEPPRHANQQFINDLASGNATAAANDTDGMSQAEVQALADHVKDMGAVKHVTNIAFTVRDDTAELAGIATFDKGKMGYSVHEVKKGDAWKISTFTFNQTSAPATSESTTPATTEPSTPAP